MHIEDHCLASFLFMVSIFIAKKTYSLTKSDVSSAPSGSVDVLPKVSYELQYILFFERDTLIAKIAHW